MLGIKLGGAAAPLAIALAPTVAIAAIATMCAGCAGTADPTVRALASRVTHDPVTRVLAARVTPGLVNVPNVSTPSGASYNDDLPTPDVVSNGPEACGRGFESSPLWNQWPRCPNPSPPAIAGRGLLPTSDSTASAALVRPWEEVTVFAWPCTAGPTAGAIAGVRCR
jgi:hypothetical protein